MTYRYRIGLICALLGGLFSLYWFFKTPCASYRNKNVLVVGTNATYPPFESIENGNVVGFDIDLARNIAERLGKEINVKNMPFDALIPELMLCKIDMIASAVTPSEQRAQKVSFSIPYTTGDPLVVITKREAAVTSVDDLFGKKVIVTPGETPDQYMSQYAQISLIRLETACDALMALKSSRADAFVTSRVNAQTLLATQENHTFATYEIPQTDAASALVIAKNNPDLLESINRILQELEIDGTLAKLRKEWGIK